MKPTILNMPASYLGIAVVHSVFNIACTAILLPSSIVLEKLAYIIVPETEDKEVVTELDERLLVTPPIALQRCNEMVKEMAEIASETMKKSISMLWQYNSDTADEIRRCEKKVDHYEDILGTYLVKLSGNQVSDADSSTISKLLKAIGDFERISDHGINVLESAEELYKKDIKFTQSADSELKTLCHAVSDILTLAYNAFSKNDLEIARSVEPLEQVVDELRAKMRNGHINRLKKGECSIEAGFVWADLLTNLERVADHCSSVAVCIIDASEYNMNVHKSLKALKTNNADFDKMFEEYSSKYRIGE